MFPVAVALLLLSNAVYWLNLQGSGILIPEVTDAYTWLSYNPDTGQLEANLSGLVQQVTIYDLAQVINIDRDLLFEIENNASVDITFRAWISTYGQTFIILAAAASTDINETWKHPNIKFAIAWIHPRIGNNTLIVASANLEVGAGGAVATIMSEAGVSGNYKIYAVSDAIPVSQYGEVGKAACNAIKSAIGFSPDMVWILNLSSARDLMLDGVANGVARYNCTDGSISYGTLTVDTQYLQIVNPTTINAGGSTTITADIFQIYGTGKHYAGPHIGVEITASGTPKGYVKIRVVP